MVSSLSKEYLYTLLHLRSIPLKRVFFPDCLGISDEFSRGSRCSKASLLSLCFFGLGGLGFRVYGFMVLGFRVQGEYCCAVRVRGFWIGVF